MIKQLSLLTIALSLCLSVTGQIRKAQKEMQLFNYVKAVDLLNKVIEKGDPDSRQEATLLLAECYRKQNDVHNAKAWYARALEGRVTDPVIIFRYAQTLRSCGEYSEAKRMFQKFDSIVPGDRRGKIFANYCDSIVEWSKITPVFETKNAQALNSKESDFGPVFYQTGILFTSDRITSRLDNRMYGWTGNNYLHLFSSDPRYLDDFYGDYSKPHLAPGSFNQDYHTGPATFNKEQTLVFINRTYVRKDKGKKETERIRTHLLKLFYSTKKDNKWSSFEPFYLNSDEFSIGHPALSPDGKILCFVSDMDGGTGGTDIYLCTFDNGQWSKPVNLGAEINTPGNEMFPFISEAGDLYFSSDELPGYGGLDIFISRRTNQGWGKPENLFQPVNSSYDDFSLVIDKSGKTGLYSSNRSGGSGSDDLYCFTKIPIPPPVVIPPPIFASGCVKDKTTLAPISGATVFLANTITGQIQVIKTNVDGCFKTPVKKGIPYIYKAMAINYIADCYSVIFDSASQQVDLTIPRDLLLDKLQINRIFKLENIYYDFDKSFIREDAKPSLNNLVRIMKENPIRVELGSHTDSRGSDEYNKKLSQRRAEAAVRFIISQGIEEERIIAKGYGESMLTNKCRNGVKCTAEEHQANRRTEFKILGVSEEKSADTFNPERFKDGEIIDIRFFPEGFFSACPRTR